MTIPQVVLDTNVIVAGLRSRRGSAYQLLTRVGAGQFDIHLSVPLVMEYRDVLSRETLNLPLSQTDIESLIEFHCTVAISHQIFFLWRPYLSDPKDDLVLELAIAGGCDSVVTYNSRHFAGIEKFGICTITPAELLREIGALP